VQFDDSDKVSTFLEECRRLNIEVLPPHINNSQIDFDIEEQPDSSRGIRFGMGAIKNAGVGALQHIIDEREENGTFDSLTDFCHRVDLSEVGKRALESLIKVGALRGFGKRDDLLAMVERIVGFSASHHDAQRAGQMSFFGGDSGLEEKLDVPPAPVKQKFTRREQLGWEKELLGLYVTGRPVDRHRDKFRVMPNLSIVQNLVAPDSTTPQDRQVKIAGEIVSIRDILTKNGNQMAILHVEDWHESAATIDVVMFPRTWEKTKAYVRQYKESKLDDDERARLETGDIEAEDLLKLTDGDIVVIQGKFDISRNEPQVICDSVSFEFENLQPDDIIAQANSYGTNHAMHETTQSEMPPSPENGTYYADDHQPPTPTHTEYALPATQGAATQSAANGGNNTQTPGNGHHPADSGDNTFDDLLGIDDEGDRSTVHIDIRFYKSDDPERDRRKLQRLHRTLIQHPGKNTFAFFIVDADGERTTILDFPNHTTGYSEELMHDLVDIVGEDNIHVEDSDNPPPS
jgi:DNA polymerase-3 subunit alpha